MHSGDNCYILDANAIRMLSYEQIEYLLSKKRQIITIEEVQFEVKSLEKVKLLKINSLCAASYEKMAEIINGSKAVRNVVNYYDNKGAADVALLAYVKCPNTIRLFDDEYIIITNDKGLREACDYLGVKWMSVVASKTLCKRKMPDNFYWS